jgi:hypothetical protein
MSTDSLPPCDDDDSLPLCDHDVFQHGKSLLAADTHACGASGFDAWIQEVARASHQRVDWHYSGGVAHVLYVGDRDAVMEAARGIPCPAQIMGWFNEGDPGLYRRGVTPAPPGAIAAWYNGGPGSTFAYEE